VLDVETRIRSSGTQATKKVMAILKIFGALNVKIRHPMKNKRMIMVYGVSNKNDGLILLKKYIFILIFGVTNWN